MANRHEKPPQVSEDKFTTKEVGKMGCIHNLIANNIGAFVVVVLKNGKKLTGKVDDYTANFLFLASDGAILNAKFNEVDYVDVVTRGI